jgi:hypothetical protein
LSRTLPTLGTFPGPLGTSGLSSELRAAGFLNGKLVSNVIVDTSAVATDPSGLAATSTRTILIEAATPPLAPDSPATTTTASTGQ